MEVLEHGNKNEFYLKIGGPNESIVFEFYLNIFILNSYRNQYQAEHFTFFTNPFK